MARSRQTEAVATAEPSTERPGVVVSQGKHATVTLAHVPVERNADWEQWFWFGSDVHIDSPHCQRAMLLADLKRAKELGAYGALFGDLFDVMQGPTDPRRHPEGARLEDRVDAYFNSVINDAVRFWQPYSDRLILATLGNHETKVNHKSGIDVLSLWAGILNLQGAQIRLGLYQGWLVLRFAEGNVKRGSINIRYAHGHGGGGEVTKGLLQAQRRAVYLPNADIVVSGHIHERYKVPFTRERLTESGAVYIEEQQHISIPGYKEEYLDGVGFHAEKGRPPKPLGCWWLVTWWSRQEERIKWELRENAR